MKISIVGIGRVGSSVGFALVLRELCKELVLVSRSRDKAQAEAMDLQHTASLSGTLMTVRAGEAVDTAGSDIVVLCASAPLPTGSRSRLDLAAVNWSLYGDLVAELVRHAPDAIYLVVANPVDVLTYRTLRVSGLDPRRVIGAGTIIDSARFRGVIARETGVHPQDIRAYILGEHGDSQFPALSIASIAGEFADSSESQWGLFREAVRSGHDIFQARGYTNHAIAGALTLIVRSIEGDDRHTMPVSTLIDGRYGVSDVCLSLPCVIGRAGVCRVMQPRLNEEEAEQFRASAQAVKKVIEACDSLPNSP